MEAKDVKVYYKPENNKTSTHERFYNFYNDSCEKLELSNFLDSIVDPEEENKEESNNIIYGIINEEIVKEYYVILTFKNTNNNKNYIIYTDNKIDQNNNLVIYSAIYDEDAPEPFISFLTSNEEWRDICSIMDAVFLYNV